MSGTSGTSGASVQVRERATARRHRNWWAVATAGLALAGAAGIGAAAGPAAADYAPYVQIDGTLQSREDPRQAEPGETLTATNDPDGPCLHDGEESTPAWTFGTLPDSYEYTGPVEFDSVILSGEVTTVEGNWSVDFTLPADLPDGLYAFSASCIRQPPPQPDGLAAPAGTRQAAPLLYDYIPAFIRVGEAPVATTTTSTPTTAPPVSPPPAAPAPAAALPGTADYTG